MVPMLVHEPHFEYPESRAWANLASPQDHLGILFKKIKPKVLGRIRLYKIRISGNEVQEFVLLTISPGDSYPAISCTWSAMSRAACLKEELYTP